MPKELLSRFRSKEDFIQYFQLMQLYVPPEKMVNKDFLR